MEKQKILTPFNYCQSQNHRITEKYSLEGASRGHLVQSPVQSMAKLIDLVQSNFESLQEHASFRLSVLVLNCAHTKMTKMKLKKILFKNFEACELHDFLC